MRRSRPAPTRGSNAQADGQPPGEGPWGPSPGRIFSPAFVRLWVLALAGTLTMQLLSASLPLYAVRLGADDAVIGLMVGAIALTSLAARPWVGMWVDRGGSGPALIAGVMLYTLAPLGYWIFASVSGVLFFRAVTGLAIALFITAGQVMAVGLAPAARRGEALGVYGIAMTLAQIVGPPAGVAVALGAGDAGLFLACTAVGLVALGLASPMRARSTPPAGPRRYAIPRVLLVPGLLMLALMLPFGANVALLVVHASRRALGNPGLVLTAHALGVLLLQAAAGRLSDRAGRMAVILPGLGLSALGMWVTSLVGGWALVAAGFLSGAALGVAQPSLYALAADLVPADQHGGALATQGIFLEIGIASGAIGGGLVARAAGLPTMFGAAGVIPALGAALAVAHARTLRRASPPRPGASPEGVM